MKALDNVATQIAGEVNMVIRNLQFEDIVRQLGEGIGEKAAVLAAINDLGTNVAVNTVAPRDSVLQALAGMQSKTQQQSARLTALGQQRQVAAQRDMSGGDVDLF